MDFCTRSRSPWKSAYWTSPWCGHWWTACGRASQRQVIS